MSWSKPSFPSNPPSSWSFFPMSVSITVFFFHFDLSDDAAGLTPAELFEAPSPQSREAIEPFCGPVRL